MCGICGIFYKNNTSPSHLHRALTFMNENMISRGPDNSNIFKDKHCNLILGHQRLAVMDLNPRSNQPFASADGRYQIIFNGEIYNYQELKDELIEDDFLFKTNSDTEVLLSLYIKYKENLFKRLKGMYSFAIWDNIKKSLFLARDPYGIKPLYYAKTAAGFLFASQVKALLASGLVSRDPCSNGQASYWLMGSIAEPFTWFKNIKSLPAGSFVYIDKNLNSFNPKKYTEIKNYWSGKNNLKISYNDAKEFVANAIKKSINRHIISDVPLGIFLSSGIDSATIAGNLNNSKSPITGLTINFDEFLNTNEDEAISAKKIADYYGIKHHKRTVSKNEFENDFLSILTSMDQPTIDGVNTWYASKAANEANIKVVLSGVGGDELFFGYPSFKDIPTINMINSVLLSTKIMAKTFQMLIRLLNITKVNEKFNYFAQESGSIYGAYWLKRGLFGFDRLPSLMGRENFENLKKDITSSYFVKESVGLLAADKKLAIGQMESMLYMRNQLLRDSDWASMAHSVELRTPFVDYALLQELSPIIYKFDKFNGKELLGLSPTKPLPKFIIKRKKTGFGIPINKWILESKKIENLVGIDYKNKKNDPSRLWAEIVPKLIYE
jgi:asparagine synthase (glutamine-hydrolysing)